LRPDEELDLVGIAPEQHFTEPPPRYTEASLIKALEEHGIGRPSTYAPTVETIRQRGYVELRERRLHPEETAYRVTDLLVEHFPEVVDVSFTARMEERLDGVARGDEAWVPVVRGFWDPFNAQLIKGRADIPKQVELTDIVCPVSGHLMVKRFSRNGWFLGCSGYPECRHTMPLPGEEAEAAVAGVGEPCPECGEGELVARRGRFGAFAGCNRYPDCKYIKKDRPAGESFGTCPKCGQGSVVAKRARGGRRGGRPFWGCDRYPACDYTVSKRPGATNRTDGGTPDAPPADG
jgi:DNA topoisomerase-1